MQSLISRANQDLKEEMGQAQKTSQDRQRVLNNQEIGPNEQIKIDLSTQSEAERLSKRLKKYNVDPVWLRNHHTDLVSDKPSDS